ncbi:hypothetical protein GCM10009610_63950 [Pseudonocardia xinjiangensis]|uniref:transposase n=1 Tax=Pseudonocardia xinjiangensis TaxID=75289 RepID=UPI0033770908
MQGYPEGTRIIVRRERPHPGAQLDLMETHAGRRYSCFATDPRAGQLASVVARHRAHAQVEDRIRTAKDTGLSHFPSRTFAINAAWLMVVMLAVDLLAWTQHLALNGPLVKAEPQDAALPAPARRCPDHPRSAPDLGPDPAVLALGPPARRGVRPPARAARPVRTETRSRTDDPSWSTRHKQQARHSRTPGPGNAQQRAREDQLTPS